MRFVICLLFTLCLCTCVFQVYSTFYKLCLSTFCLCMYVFQFFSTLYTLCLCIVWSCMYLCTFCLHKCVSQFCAFVFFNSLTYILHLFFCLCTVVQVFFNSLSYILHCVCASMFFNFLNYILHFTNLYVCAFCINFLSVHQCFSI